MPRICLRLVAASKKNTGQYSAARAALGGRTLKTGQSRCFVGYKKHTLRLWLHDYSVGVLLVPLISWVTPAAVFEGGLLVPSLHYCQRQAPHCPQQFAYRPEQHETLLGQWPLASRLAQHLLQQVRPWIEPAQSFEKNQLGLGDVFLNSLRFAWTMALLADATLLLRARVLPGRPPSRRLLADLMPLQLTLKLETETAPSCLSKENPNP